MCRRVHGSPSITHAYYLRVTTGPMSARRPLVLSQRARRRLAREEGSGMIRPESTPSFRREHRHGCGHGLVEVGNEHSEPQLAFVKAMARMIGGP